MSIEASRFEVFGASKLDRIPQVERLGADALETMKAVAAVLPFRVNRYVIDELIDWSDRDDPMFQLTFPQPGMLAPDDLATMRELVRRGASKAELQAAARPIQERLNPHPGGQKQLNVPREGSEGTPGIQHKYRETVLLFPAAGQTCHAYCTYCFRWAQFVGQGDLKFAAKEPDRLAAYVRRHPDVSSVLFTGGDPMVMKTKVLRRYVAPFLEMDHVETIRFGTKSVAYWPQRFVSDDDADDLLRLFEEIEAAGKSVAVMAHYSHPRELSTDMAQAAVRRIRGTGAVIRTQAPLIGRVNDDPTVWRDLWRAQVRLGAIPYYMFVERDTGPQGYFGVPLARALSIYDEAYRQQSGLGRTARGPVMSCTPGKVLVDGIVEVDGRKLFTLKFLQAREPSWVNQPFFARFDEDAAWWTDLRPADERSARFWRPPSPPASTRRRLATFSASDPV